MNRTPALAAIGLVCCIFCHALPRAYGEPHSNRQDNAPVDMGEMVVTGAGMDLHDKEVLSPAIVDAAGIAPSVDSLLDHFPGIDLTRRTFSGSENQRLSIRGFDESRSLIMLNGRPLHGAGVYGAYYVDWASLSLEDIESVELIRGITPAKYGNALGGLVNITTVEGTEEPSTKLRARGGSMETLDLQARYSGPAGPCTFSLSGGRYETDGYLRNAFVNRNMFSAKLQFPLSDDMKLSTGIRYTENEAGMIVHNMPGTWGYDPDEPDSLGAQLGGPYLSFRQSLTGPFDSGAGPFDWGDGSYWNDKRLNLDLGVSGKSEDLDFSAQTYLIDQDREEYFYAIDDPNHLVLRRDSEPEDNNWGWKADFTSRLGAERQHTVEYGLGGHYLGYGGATVKSVDAAYFSRMPTDSPSKTDPVTTLHGAYAQDACTIGGNIQVQAGLRIDKYRADGPEANAVTVDETKAAPRLACNFNPWSGGRATARIGQAYRFPTNPEYYWWYSGYKPATRKDLAPEKADQYEIELEQGISDNMSVLVRSYYYEVDDYIRTIFGYKPSRVIYNIDRVDFTGVEIEACCDVSSALKVSINFTHQQTEKHGDVLDSSTTLTDDLPELPDNKANLKLEYGRDNGLNMELKIGYVDERWTTRGNLAMPGGSYLGEMESYFDVDMRISYPVYRDESDREIRIEITGDNVFDADIVEEYGYPLPGATVMAGIRAEF